MTESALGRLADGEATLGAPATLVADAIDDVPALEAIDRTAARTRPGQGPPLPGPGFAGLRRNAALASIIQIAGVGVRYASQLVLARWLGVTAFGQLTYSVNFSQIAATPVDGGMATAVTRFVPEATARGDPVEQAKVVRGSRLICLVLGGGVALLLGGVVAVVGGGPAPKTVILIALLAVPLFALTEVQTGICRSYERIAAAFVAPVALQPILVVALAFTIAAATTRSVTVAVVASVGAIAVVCVQQAWSIRRLRPRHAEAHVDRADLRRWSGVSLPLLVLSLSQLVFSRMDLLFVGIFLGAEKAGIYSVAFRTAAIILLVQTAVNAVVTPRIARLHWAGERAQLETTMLAAVRWVLIGSAVLSVPLIVVGGPILGVFGSPFRTGATTLSVYLIGQLVSIGAGPAGWVLGLAGEHRKAAAIGVNSGLITIVAYLVMIPTLGIVGAAAANSLGMTIKNVWSNIEVRRCLGYRIGPIRALRGRRG
jgi:O-antigen/teichoic acid export membrane protein